MASQPASKDVTLNTKGEPTNRRGYWGDQMARSDKKFYQFVLDGDHVIDRFMLESKNPGNLGNPGYPGDRYNMLYSSTETIKPSLYAATPKVEVQTRQQDTDDSIKVASSLFLESIGQYMIDMMDFDYVIKNCVSDYLLPGLGCAWIRYDPKFAPMYENDNTTPSTNDDGSPREYKTGERVCLDYVNWKDMRWGSGRVWEELPWVGRRVYFTKQQAVKRFGKDKANKLDYSHNQYDRRDRQAFDNPKKQAVIWEIWDKDNGEVVWYAEEYSEDVLDCRKDPLKLQNFFPCARPLRAVWSTRDFIPKALYSQYKPQAAELDRLTERIRYITEAIKVRGLYDGSQESLVNLLEGPGNKMIPIQDWASFIGQGGVEGAVQWVPIQEIATVLAELFKQRDIAKNEIYEITGFSDIIRGVSKASETLGAQEIKSNWATGRLKDMQAEVQRFCRDVIALMVEVAAEHFSDKTLLLYSGLTIPPISPQEKQMEAQYQQAKRQYPLMVQQAKMQAQQPQQPPQPGAPPPPQQPPQIPPPPQAPPPTQHAIVTQMFQKVLKLIKDEPERCAAVNIETDSTIMPDEDKERQDRMQFLSSMGAFLQQAGPLALQFPDMRGLLGGIMMFTLRTFNAARPLEKEFEVFQQKLAQMPPTPPPGQQNDGGQQAQAAIQVAQIRAQTDNQTNTATNQTKMSEAQLRAQVEREKNQMDHQYRMGQLQVEQSKVDLTRTQTGLDTLQQEREHNQTVQQQAHEHAQSLAQTHIDAQQSNADRVVALTKAFGDNQLANRQQDLAERAQASSEAQAATEADQGQQQIDNAAQESD